MDESSTPVSRLMDQAKQIHLDREKVYGSDGYRIQGEVMEILFRSNLTKQLKTPDDYAKFYLFSKIVEKVCRYAMSYDNGHADSLTDLSVYALKLQAHDAKL